VGVSASIITIASRIASGFPFLFIAEIVVQRKNNAALTWYSFTSLCPLPVSLRCGSRTVFSKFRRMVAIFNIIQPDTTCRIEIDSFVGIW
jgi:hypothetical protein